MDHLDTLLDLTAKILGTTPENVRAQVAQRQEQARRRIERNNYRYGQALAAMTDVQSCVVDKLEADTCRINKLYVNRQSGNVAVMMVKSAVWWQAKGKIGRKLIMVYPDGTTSDTFERTISIRRDY